MNLTPCPNCGVVIDVSVLKEVNFSEDLNKGKYMLDFGVKVYTCPVCDKNITW